MNEKKISSISINLNQICNLNCSYCYRHVVAADKREMNDETLAQTIKFIKELKPEQVGFPQREPTLSFNKIKIIVEALGDDYRYNITTNGYALTKNMVNYFKEHKFGILISYDSVMQHQRPVVDGTDSDARVRTSCRMLIEAGLNPTCLITVTEQSLPHIEAILEDVIELGFKGVFLNRDMQSKSPTCVKNVKLFEEKMRIAKEMGYEAGISLGPFFRMEQKAQNTRVKNPCDYTCGAGKGGVGIDPEGIIRPCHHTNAWAEMDINLGTIWTGIDWDKKKWFREAGPLPEQFEKCQSCDSSGLCGMCYLDNHENTGDMLKPDPLTCEINEALYRAAGMSRKAGCNINQPRPIQNSGRVIAVYQNGTCDVEMPDGTVHKGLKTP